MHGADSLFVAPTVRIGWAVLKDESEEATTVVLRVANSAAAYAAVSLEGVDPFSKSRKVLLPVQSFGRKVDLVVSRDAFGEFPSCEVHLYADQAPTLTVFYPGVPDTTPEFTTRGAMDAYLDRVLGAAGR